jgi:transcriptional regulator with GAF, ATPase, and Fis domain
MDRSRRLLLDVWREVCRHIEIEASAANIARFLARHAPLDRLLVLRIDRGQESLVVAASPAMRSGTPQSHDLLSVAEGRRSLAPAEFQRLLQWCRTGRLLVRGKRLSGALGVLLPEGTIGDVLAAPLLDERRQPSGAVVLIARADRMFDEVHQQMLESLREPLAAALENDRRLHEIAALREAAEADRGALLRRLGRSELVDTVVGEQSGLRQVMERVDLVARSDVPVLILGETGTGKELIARAIHQRGKRGVGPFIRVNCGAIPAELIDSQLFGHERGSFTGADQLRQGWFERADGGTLLLDEIGELPFQAQVRFLRVLQDGFVERVGGRQPVHVDVRIVAATHRDLAGMVRDGTFREDLWYRLAVFPILLPPLRDRRDDIPALARHFAERAAHRFGLMPVAPSDDDIRLLQTYGWPGNIRELGAVIDRAAILGDGRGLEVAKALGQDEAAASRPSPQPSTVPPASAPLDGGSIASLDAAMRQHIERALAATRGRIEGPRGAAALLCINPHTLRARMRKLGIDWPRFRGSARG